MNQPANLPPPPRRPLGKSGRGVSEIGLGCNRIGEDRMSDREWGRLLERAADLGVTLFDTAAQYAGGRSEELIGRAFGSREDLVIATKISPRPREEGGGFTKQSVIAGAERSLRKLKRECLDVFQTHGSGRREEMLDPGWAEAMDLLKQQGKIRLRGAAVFDAAGAAEAIRRDLADVLQITYNLLDTGHSEPILPLAAEHGVGLLARMPYQRGVLTGKFRSDHPDVSDHRARLQGKKLRADIAGAEKFGALGEGRPGGMSALAMQFVLAESRLSCTIPGARSATQLEANLAAAAAPPLTPEEAASIAEIRSELKNQTETE